MRDEPTKRGVEALAEVLATTPPTLFVDRRVARLILASDWYAERIAQARREGAAEAIGDAADWLDSLPSMPQEAYAERMRKQAAALRGDA